MSLCSFSVLTFEFVTTDSEDIFDIIMVRRARGLVQTDVCVVTACRHAQAAPSQGLAGRASAGGRRAHGVCARPAAVVANC